MKSVAIIYDKFLVQGGGERVCEMLLEAFPQAQLYALNASPRGFWEQKLGRPVLSPPMGALFSSRMMVSAFYPLAALLMASLKVKADVVIAYSSTCGKFARVDCDYSILYSNYPNRGLYQPEKLVRSKFLRLLMAPMMALMKPFERMQIRKYDRKFSISETSRQAMFDFAGVDTEVLMPPFNEQGMADIGQASVAPSVTVDPYYVLISRLEPEKELQYVIDAFNKSDKLLRVIGSGSLLEQFKRIAGENIMFLGFVGDADLARHLAGARALIFPSEIEYSLVPLEAASLGVPVIAFDSPAMREILVDGEVDAEGGNAIFYGVKSSEALTQAIDRFDKLLWNVEGIKRSAAHFGRPAFIETIRALVYGATVSRAEKVEQ